MAGSANFCAGSIVQSASLVPGFDLTGDGMNAWPANATAARVKALNELPTMDSGLAVVQAANKVRQDAVGPRSGAGPDACGSTIALGKSLRTQGWGPQRVSSDDGRPAAEVHRADPT